ncbi:hypothetical protein VTJ49DRAFT_4297 [Mycothermus thermophilus]|uniref:Uncharacterized protein n=1 Tax=Humicola insolens TaxID=85995 RepID=A0ABR3V5Q0_HUMIN
MLFSRPDFVSSRNTQGCAVEPTRHARNPASHHIPNSPSPVSSSFLQGNEDCLFNDTDLSNPNSINMPVILERPRQSGFRPVAPSLPRTETMTAAKATMTTATPVQIPSRPRPRDTAHPPRLHRALASDARKPRRPKHAHSPDSIPPSVAALLAVTSIPPPKTSRSVRQTKAEKMMTVDSIMERAQKCEKEFSLSLSKSPLDILLMSPEDLEADDASVCESVTSSVLSTRTISMESMPSLGSSFATEAFSPLQSPRTPPRRRSIQPRRRSLELISSPTSESESNHPLSSPEIDVEELDFRVFEPKDETADKKSSRLPFTPLKSAFKSNLTASLRALRQAAKSFSNLNFSSIPPEDFLTRSILTIDPQVPYTDERRPPPLQEEPTAALRRYLNPTTTSRIGKSNPLASGPALRTFTASIQMQTYKVQRARSSSPPPTGRLPYPSTGPSSQGHDSQLSQPKPTVTEQPLPGPRQREMRENADFIRIAVLEMAMRKSGKFDEQWPGRARWALPPRKPSTKPYKIGPDGVPARWVATTAAN